MSAATKLYENCDMYFLTSMISRMSLHLQTKKNDSNHLRRMPVNGMVESLEFLFLLKNSSPYAKFCLCENTPTEARLNVSGIVAA